MIIAIDFDGTCVTHKFPEIGEDIGAIPILKSLTEKGHKLILFTMRCNHPKEFELTGKSDIYAEKGEYLSAAINWFKENDIPLYGIQMNPTQHTWTTSQKVYAHLYIDDAALGCPLVYPENGDRPYADWIKIEEWLIENLIL